jgi:hypothetical protein
MSCEEEFNALRRAEWELAAFRKRLSDTATGTIAGAGPAPDVLGSDTEDIQRMMELTAAVRHRYSAYDRCRGRIDVEALMREETGAPLGGGASPPR